MGIMAGKSCNLEDKENINEMEEKGFEKKEGLKMFEKNGKHAEVASFVGDNSQASSQNTGIIDVENGGVESLPIMSEADCSTVDSGFDDNSHDSVITPAMLEEERILQRNLKKEEEKFRRAHEKELHDKEMKEMRYKRLMTLLKKSQFYAEFMKARVNKYLSTDKRKHPNIKGSKKRKKIAAVEDFSEDILSAFKKFKNSAGAADDCYQDALPEKNADNVKGTVDSDKKTTIAQPVKEEKMVVSGLGIEVPARQPKLLEGAALRDYQLDGLDWLKLLFESGMNGILADEMGLGKTVQVISLVCHLYESDVCGPFLIVGPLSTLPNWLIEFNRFAPQLPVVLYHGPEKDRKVLRGQIHKKYSLRAKKVSPVVLTSYEIPVRDHTALKNVNWKYIIVDEGHRLKNYKTALARTLSSFNSVNRLLLTGTPLQNNLTELWSLLHFLLPDIFDTLDAFQSWFEIEDIERDNIADDLVEQEKKDKILSILHKILSPFLLRRIKTEVNLHLPPKKEVCIYCPMSQIQRKLYSAILDKSIIQFLQQPENSLVIADNPDGTKAKRRSALRKNNHIEECKSFEKNTLVVDNGIDQYFLDVKLRNPQMCLRKAANHPYLINMPVLPGSKILRVDEGIVTDSGKVTVLDGLLTRLKKRNHKAIIFSTFTSILDLLEEYMIMRGHEYERLDGTCNLEERKSSIYRFNTDENVFVFLISTRAGGLGINLTSADTAIVYDSDWNPQADLQAQDRCHRIGQTRPVVVYRFVTEGTIDEKIYSRACAKRKLEKIIIHGGKFNPKLMANRGENVDLEELKELLNSKQESQQLRRDGSVMTEDEWNALLDRSDLMAAKTDEQQ